MLPESTIGVPAVTAIRALLLTATAGLMLPCVPAVASPAKVDQLLQQALQFDRNPQRGAKLYARNCAGCHGPEALGNSVSVIPALAGQRRAYLVKQLADFAESERDSKQMHAVVARTQVSQPQDWVDIAAWLNSLPPAVFQETGDGQGLELGEATFQEQCTSCHEDDARGDDDGFVPSLRSQHYSYLLRQMHGLASWKRHNVEPDLVRFLASLDDEELTGIADYLSRMQGPVRDRTRLDDSGTAGD